MKKTTHDSPSQGFALVITLSLMVLLTLLVVGLLSLSGIALRNASGSEAMATARNNARLALMLAIGELQKSLGPDKAVSAPSEILASQPAKPNTTGVWDSWDFNPNGGALSYRDEKTKRFRRWLVSSADPAALTSQNFGAAMWTGDTIELVGDGSLGDKAAASAKVVAGKVPLTRDSKVQGALAWHVADESMKARINLYRDPSLNTTLAQQRALLAGHRPDPSVIQSTVGSRLTFLPKDDTAKNFADAAAGTGKLTDLAQVDLLKDARNKIKEFRNDVTPHSLGLLVDVRKGGLKQDLSSVFEMNASLPDAFASKKLYQSTHGITGVSDPYWSTLSGYYNSFRSITNRDTNPTIATKPVQDVLITTQTTPTTYNPGPVIAKVEIVLTFVVRESHGMWTPLLTAQSSDLRYMGHLILTPVVTLHNPYNINLSFDEMDVAFQNVPVAFKFYVNNQAQNTSLVSLNSLYWDDNLSQDRKFIIGIANWSDYSAGTTGRSGPIIMKPGQTMVCGIYMDPHTIFSQGDDSSWITNDRDLRGKFVKATPGFKGRAFGYDLDVLSPDDYSVPQAQQSDGVYKVLGLKASDTVHMEVAIQKPPMDTSGQFQVLATITSNGTTKQYGGLSFKYTDDATLKSVFPTVFRYPSSGEFTAMDAHVSNTVAPDAWFSNHAGAKTVAVFSAYAHTTNGGVYETGKRTVTAGALNALVDGRVAGKPFLFNNPARTVVSMDLKKEKLGAHSHELNLQRMASAGSFDDYLTVDATNRSPYLTGNTTSHGIKSGSYLELPVGPLQTIADFRRSNALTSFYLPNFVQPVANSIISPLMSTDKVNQIDSAVATYALLDHSVLANHALYDRFYFSTFATVGTVTPDKVFAEFMGGQRTLPAQRFQPYLPAGRTVDDAKAELYASGIPRNTAYQMAAEYQLLRGPFNVNSMSVQAWKAMLATLNKSQIVTLWQKSGKLENNLAKGTPIVGMSLLNGGGSDSRLDPQKIDDQRTNEWNGCHELSDSQLEQLAKSIVEQVRLRGPFLSLSEFVNRQIGAESDLTRSGALDAAIAKSKVNDTAFVTQVPITVADVSDPKLYNYKTPTASTGNPAAGAPGWISQGDLMRLLEPAATVRSDTFVIRVCGEAWDAKGQVTARAYAEAVVQRMPEYVDPVDRPSLNVYTDTKAALANRTFGRRINVVAFRWLASNEI